MAWNVPKLADLSASVRAAFRAEMPGTDAAIWPNNTTPTAKVLAGLAWGLYLKIGYLARQIFAATAEGEYLDRHAAEFGMSRLPAAQASGYLGATASSAGVIEAGAVFARADGVQVASTERVIFSAPTATPVYFGVRALNAGKAGNTLGGAMMSVVSGATGIAAVSVEASGLGGGADLETDEALRARVLFRKRNAPHGGAPADYVQWGLAVPGVTRIFIERVWVGAGTVRVFPLTDDATPGGVPVTASVAAVQAAMAAQAPATAAVTVAAATAQTINVTISGLAPNTSAVQQAVVAELAEMFRRLGRVAGNDTPVDGMPYLATPQTFSRSWIWQAIANATGEERHVLVSPGADVTITAGAIPVLGTVTFT